jgi:hypothetical protein
VNVSKKIARNKLRRNIQLISDILATVKPGYAASKEVLDRFNELMEENNILRSILTPTPKIPNNKLGIDNTLRKIDERYNIMHPLLNTEYICANCGTPYGNNKMNNIDWCFTCNKPFKYNKQTQSSKIDNISIRKLSDKEIFSLTRVIKQ